jgi:hypothetical protein
VKANQHQADGKNNRAAQSKQASKTPAVSDAVSTVLAKAATPRPCMFLEMELAEIADHFDVARLRLMADRMEKFVEQARFKADLMDGRRLEVTHWIAN